MLVAKLQKVDVPPALSKFVHTIDKKNMTRTILPIILCATLVACSSERPPVEKPLPTPESSYPVVRPLSYTIVRTLSHDTSAFTQGLVVYNAEFLESTGQNGLSSIRRVDIVSGKVKKIEKLEARFFGEGITVLAGKAYMITWLSQTGFVFDPVSLKKLDSFSYAGEGWGLTNDGSHLIMSNGSNVLSVINPLTHAIVRSIAVTMNGSPVAQLNELEWINGEIWANVWQSERIVRINPETGNVTAVLDLTGILPDSARSAQTDVLNGIAYDAKTKLFYVTGKNWPFIFEIRVTS